MAARRQRNLGSGLAALVFLAVLPTGLVAVVGWPLPRHWPSRATWEAFAAQPLTKPVMTGAIACVLWLIWAVAVSVIAADLARWLRWRLRRLARLRVPTTMQATTTGLLGATILHPAMSNPSLLPAQPAPPTPPVAGALHPSPLTVPSTAGEPTRPVAGPTDREPVPADGPATSVGGHIIAAEPGDHGAGGLSLPGGQWISPALAALIAGTAATVWQRRRATYRPGPPGDPDRTDPDLAPLPDTVTTVQHLLQPDIDAPDADHPRPVQLVAATRGHPVGGIGVTGPGAPAAARALLATALLTPPDCNDGAAVVAAVVTGPALRVMLDTTVMGAVAGLVMAADITQEIGLVEQQALIRTTTIRRPPLILILTATELTEAGLETRCAVLARAATGLGITVLVLGPCPAGPTWLVTDTGSYTAIPSPHPDMTPAEAGEASTVGRLSVLDTRAFLDLIDLLTLAGAPADTPSPDPAGPGGGSPRDATARTATAPGLATANAGDGRARLRLLGTIHLHAGDEELRLARSAALAALVYLAVHPEGATANQLARALWPQLPPHTTTQRVYTTVSALRRTLATATQGPTVVRHGERYRLDPRTITVDLWDLHDAARTATTTNNPATRRQALGTVVGLDTGPLAAPWAWPWLEPAREATRRTICDARAGLGLGPPDRSPSQ